MRQETQLAVTKAKSSLLKYYKPRLYYYGAVWPSINKYIRDAMASTLETTQGSTGIMMISPHRHKEHIKPRSQDNQSEPVHQLR